jgi:hypothetical protein
MEKNITVEQLALFPLTILDYQLLILQFCLALVCPIKCINGSTQTIK